MIVRRPEDLDAAAVLRVADGADVELAPELLAALDERRTAMLDVIASGARVYGVTTGAGAQSVVDLDPDAQARQSTALLLARAVGGPPWLEEREVRALLACRLRTLVGPDSAASPGLAQWLVSLLRHRVVPAVPRAGSGSAGEIVPLAHAFGHLGDAGEVLRDGRAVPADPVLAAAGLRKPVLGPKEGIALLGGVPVATGLAVLAADRARRIAHQELLVAAGQVVVAGVSRDPYDELVGRADPVLDDVLTGLRTLVGHEPAPRSLQAPVSFRVVGPVLAHVHRTLDAVDAAVERATDGVTDSPAYDHERGLLLGTPGFHGLDLAAGADGVRAAVVHAASVGAARLHRLLDPRTTGLPAQLALDPGPHAGLVAVHKRAVGAVHACLPVAATSPTTVETSGGQEDVQAFATEAMESLRTALDAWEEVVACGLLAVVQALALAPERMPDDGTALGRALRGARGVVAPGAADRPWGSDVTRLCRLLGSGWGRDTQAIAS